MITRRDALLGGLALPLFGGLLGQAAFSQQYFTRDGVALRGYDPVAYFITGTPQSGDEAFAAEWGGTVWHFTSAQNRDLFLNAPESYAPQYGGYCAWAVSEGYTAPIDPDAWRIVEGKLYLNASRRIQNRWERDISGHIARADANWPVLRAGL
ncbi:YHS domain protein [Rhodobacteraceae bacterium XHP0102]|nr:YHS domain protein [Rhodobacteraceae bacterium XHP0102]